MKNLKNSLNHTYKKSYRSFIGDLTMESDGESITRLDFDTYGGQDDSLEVFDMAEKWLDDYFDGKNPQVSFSLNPQCSEFSKSVWQILMTIPYGSTLTYGKIASRLSPTMAPQAVGGAVGRNPIAIIIPCHRVIGANGKLTGYSAGIDKKIKLLTLENVLK